MAYFFALAVECGDEHAARACAAHFAAPDGIPTDVSVKRSAHDGAWWTVVVPRGESTSGVTSDEVAHSLSTAGRALLERLRTASPFRFAVIGVEAYEAIAIDDIDAATGADPSFRERFHGLVVCDEIATRLGPEAALEPFAPGYSWLPYQGERHP